MMESENALFVFIDVQGKLADMMYEKDAFFDSLRRVLRGVHALRLPVIWTEQNPLKVGRTLPEFAKLLHPARPLTKMTFSCCGNDSFMTLLKRVGCRQVILAGMETHVCVYQTARDLKERGYEVEVLADAVSSRTAQNKQFGLDKIRSCGAGLTTVESLLFELMSTAEHPAFKTVLEAIK